MGEGGRLDPALCHLYFPALPFSKILYLVTQGEESKRWKP